MSYCHGRLWRPTQQCAPQLFSTSPLSSIHYHTALTTDPSTLFTTLTSKKSRGQYYISIQMHHGYSRQKVDVFGKHTFSCSSGSNSSAGSQLPNILLGVTNPFFTKALDHWPHIVKLGGGAGSSSPNDQPNGGSSPKTAGKGHSPFKGHNGVGGSNHKKVHLGVFSKLGR